jgi:hypothetical protein
MTLTPGVFTPFTPVTPNIFFSQEIAKTCM